MTSKNMSLRNKPFLLKAAGKDYLWGGTRLNTEYNKEIPLSPLAESWECSTHPDGLSIVASGEFEGWTLKRVLEVHPEYLGSHPEPVSELPILLKLIDAKQDLSVQVHPDNQFAYEYEGGQSGKTEMWYVVDAKKQTKLIYGFQHDVTREQIEESLNKGDVEKYLQKVSVKKNDIFYIEAGTVHAIGAGALIAEVQQSSNLTYRIHDYGRVDKAGKRRELHIEKALRVASLEESEIPRQPMRLLKYKNGSASELLCRCEYFQVERYLLNTESTKEMVEFQVLENSFKIFLCLEGCGTVFIEDGYNICFFKGDCIFIPANSEQLKFHGRAKFLGVNC